MERKEFLEKVLAYGRQAGFADCEVYYRGGKAFEVLILEGEVSDYENSREEGLAFRGNINGRTGYAYTEQLTEDAFRDAFEQAVANPMYRNLFIRLSSEEYSMYNADLVKLTDEMRVKYILGDASFDKWDDYVKEYINIGGLDVAQSLLDIYNEKNGTDLVLADYQ